MTSERGLVRASAFAILAATGGLPVGAALAGGASADLSLLATPRIWSLLLVTTSRSLAVTAIAVVFGALLGAAFARLHLPARRFLLALHVLPACLPPLLPALGWFHLFGVNGPLGSEATSRLLFSEAGAIVVLAAALTPIASVSTWLGIASIDASIEEAGRVVAPPLTVLRRILLPAAWPAITLAALLIFVLAFGELAVPMFLRVDAYPAVVFSRLGGIAYAPGEAAVLVLPLVPIALFLFAIERRFIAPRIGSVAGFSSRSPMRLARGEAAIALLVAIAVLATSLPIIGLASAARFAGALEWVGPSAINSLLAASIAAAAIALLGVVLGHAAARNDPIGRTADASAIVLFMMPPAVLGLGMITIWNRPLLSPIYGSLAVLVIGFVARYAGIGIHALRAVFSRSSPSFEEAAAAAGARHLRMLRSILVPMHARSILGAFLLALLFCLRDVETAILFYPPGGETLPVRIFTLEANGPPAAVAALALFQVGLTALLLFGGWSLSRGAR